MSDNLCAKCGKDVINLWQTPTQITRIILVDDRGGIKMLKGKNARRALMAYREWVRYSRNGSWESMDALNEYTEAVNEHIWYIDQILDSFKPLEVYTI